MPNFISPVKVSTELELVGGAEVKTPGWTIPHVNPFVHLFDSMGYPDGIAVSYHQGYTSFDTATTGFLHYRCRLPYPCKLNHVVAAVSGAGGHIVPPQYKPTLTASIRSAAGTGETSLGSETDPTSSGGVFDSNHYIVLPVITSPLNIAILGPTYLSAVIRNEYGSNSQPGFQVFVVSAYLEFDQLPIW